MESAEKILSREKGIRPVVLRNRLRQLMWEKVGIFRSEHGLREAQAELEEISEDLENQALALGTRHHNQELVEGLENHFLVATGRCVIEGALQRTESRGAHYRQDHPVMDNKEWLKHLLIRKSGETFEMETIPVELGEYHP